MPIFSFGFELPESVKGGAAQHQMTATLADFSRRHLEQLSVQEMCVLRNGTRIEVFAASEQMDISISKFFVELQKEFNWPADVLYNSRFHADGRNALRQFFRLAIGMDANGELAFSGEDFRRAFEISRGVNLVGPKLNKLFQRGLWLAEKVRIQLNVQKNAITPESVLVEIAQKMFGDLKDHKALIAANGYSFESLARKLEEKNIGEMLFVDIERQHSQKLDRFGVAKIKSEQLSQVLPSIDLLLMFSKDFERVFEHHQISKMMSRRNNRPLLFVSYLDDSQPDPFEKLSLSDVYNIYYYNKRDLEKIVAGNLKEHQKAAAVIDQLIDREVDDFIAWIDAKQQYRSGNIIGKSHAMQEILELVVRIAQTDISALIDGESGTGKELIARAIHEHSGRAQNPFIVVNCGALPESLLESELFGHVRGAFTGATHNKMGLIEAANHGTIFLDEIGETSLAMQVKLLRFLQEGEIKPVGSHQTLKVDVRLITATNRDLEEMITRGLFRQDLFYRLNVIQITIPPLREHREDILPLAEFFIKKFSDKIHKSIYGIDEQAQKLLCEYDWPGNVRQLENAIERAVALCLGKYLSTADFPTNMLKPASSNHHGDAADMSLKNLEKNHIAAMLHEFEWNYDLVAKILGIGRTTLWRKMKEYNISSHQREPS
jgi:glutamyl-tRNA reductase